MLATRGLLWVGTNVGIIVTLTLPRLQGVPLVSGALNVALHRHLGPVTILLSLTPQSDNVVGSGGSLDGKQTKSRRTSLEAKQDDMESIYGLYSDLMKVGDYVGVRSPTPNVNATRLAWELSHMGVSDDSTSDASNAIYQDGRPRNAAAVAAAAAAAQAQAQAQAIAAAQQKQLRRLGSPTDPQPSASATQPVNDHLTGAEQGAVSGGQPAAYSGNELYEATARAHSEASSKGDSQRQIDPRVRAMAARGESIYGGTSPESPGSGIQKTALLLTGGNGYKRGMIENPYSSQHAHCIIWEHKL